MLAHWHQHSTSFESRIQNARFSNNLGVCGRAWSVTEQQQPLVSSPLAWPLSPPPQPPRFLFLFLFLPLLIVPLLLGLQVIQQARGSAVATQATPRGPLTASGGAASACGTPAAGSLRPPSSPPRRRRGSPASAASRHLIRWDLDLKKWAAAPRIRQHLDQLGREAPSARFGPTTTCSLHRVQTCRMSAASCSAGTATRGSPESGSSAQTDANAIRTAAAALWCQQQRQLAILVERSVNRRAAGRQLHGCCLHLWTLYCHWKRPAHSVCIEATSVLLLTLHSRASRPRIPTRMC